MICNADVHNGDDRHHLAEKIRKDKRYKIIYICGDTASGKTTLAAYLYSSLHKNGCPCYIDCDSGQSVIGPPGSLGLEYSRDRHLLSFTGSSNPTRSLERHLSAVTRIRMKALAARSLTTELFPDLIFSVSAPGKSSFTPDGFLPAKLNIA